MLNGKNDVRFLNNDYVGKFDPEDEDWENLTGDEEMPENIEWFEEIDNGDLDDYSFENDFDELDLNDT
jgi:hypothetical protein